MDNKNNNEEDEEISCRYCGAEPSVPCDETKCPFRICNRIDREHNKKKVYELLDNPKPSLDCENCGETFSEDDNNGEGYKNEGDVAGCRWCEECWLTHKCADCDNHEDDVGDGDELNPRCSECRKKYEE